MTEQNPPDESLDLPPPEGLNSNARLTFGRTLIRFLEAHMALHLPKPREADESQLLLEVADEAVLSATRAASQHLNELIDAVMVGGLPTALLGDLELVGLAQQIDVHNVIKQWREDHVESFAKMLETDSTIKMNDDVLMLDTLWEFCATVQFLEEDLRQYLLEMSGQA